MGVGSIESGVFIKHYLSKVSDKTLRVEFLPKTDVKYPEDAGVSYSGHPLLSLLFELKGKTFFFWEIENTSTFFLSGGLSGEYPT